MKENNQVVDISSLLNHNLEKFIIKTENGLHLTTFPYYIQVYNYLSENILNSYFVHYVEDNIVSFDYSKDNFKFDFVHVISNNSSQSFIYTSILKTIFPFALKSLPRLLYENKDFEKDIRFHLLFPYFKSEKQYDYFHSLFSKAKSNSFKDILADENILKVIFSTFIVSKDIKNRKYITSETIRYLLSLLFHSNVSFRTNLKYIVKDGFILSNDDIVFIARNQTSVYRFYLYSIYFGKYIYKINDVFGKMFDEFFMTQFLNT